MKEISAKKVNIVITALIIFFTVILSVTFGLLQITKQSSDNNHIIKIKDLMQQAELKENENIIFDINNQNNKDPIINNDSNNENNEDNITEDKIIVYNNFFDIYNFALQKFYNDKNMYSESVGTLFVNGKYGLFNISNITGRFNMSKARNIQQKKYFEYEIVSNDNYYNLNFYMNAFCNKNLYKIYYPGTGYKYTTKQDFINNYNSDIDFWFYNINKDSANVTNFMYDKYIKKYKAKIVLNCSYLNTYNNQISKFIDLKDGVNITKCEINFTFNQNGKFDNLVVKENYKLKNSKENFDLNVENYYVEDFRVCGDNFIKINDPQK